jgi:hypothetical protein
MTQQLCVARSRPQNRLQETSVGEKPKIQNEKEITVVHYGICTSAQPSINEWLRHNALVHGPSSQAIYLTVTDATIRKVQEYVPRTTSYAANLALLQSSFLQHGQCMLPREHQRMFCWHAMLCCLNILRRERLLNWTYALAVIVTSQANELLDVSTGPITMTTANPDSPITFKALPNTCGSLGRL